ncbi:MAG: 5-formyltetrahydrofolate cyclo-ligase [Xanthomonadales bacterium]|nr:5-formyltetrahydrofolate cyclo-ligase [Xanthomonadales bacterium]
MPDRQTPEHKTRLRHDFRERRRRLDAAVRADADRRICETLLDLSCVSPGARLAAYWPFDGEPDLRPALETLHRRGTRVCLPIVPQQAGAGLEMHAWTPGSEIHNGRLGQGEPAAGDVVAVQDLDIVLLPLVAWDRAGARLGMGAGYYDRYLAPVAGHLSPLRIGIAYAAQEAKSLPADPWDVPLHGLVCEHGWIEFEAI